MADLYTVLVELIAKQRRAGANGRPGDELYQPGRVVAVKGDGTYDVAFGGAVVNANPETDLPLTPGQNVYVSKVRNGRPVVHGPR